VGALYVAPEWELGTIIEGGTGGNSESLEPPSTYPERLEAGTLNGPGLAGLGAALALLESEGLAARAEREAFLARRLRHALAAIPGLRIYGPTDTAFAAPLVSLAVEGLSSGQTARILDKEFHIAVRAGLHCSPEAHRVAGTLDSGLVRLSIGHATSTQEVDSAVEALGQIAGRPSTYWLTEWERQHV